jgi:transketolase
MFDKIDQLCVNTIRTLAMDAVQAADSGHPGTPMAMAPVAYTLWQRHLRFDPNDPLWPNRDRFVLSAGHASMLLYALLHLTGVKAVDGGNAVAGEPAVSLADIRDFRQLGSLTPGHPEYRWTAGVETTSGPLGQGVGASVGMAIAGRWLAAYFNRPGFDLFDFNVYALAGDGCMMEGLSGEAASLAGHLKLSNLCWIYDNNRITIEGRTDLAFTEDVAARFSGYGWNVLRVDDANDLTMLSRAFDTFRNTSDRPTLVIVDSHIAFGAPHKQDTHAAHGEPLGEEEIRLTKRSYGWPEDAQFLVPDEVIAHFKQGIGDRGRGLRDAWKNKFEDYKAAYPELADHLLAMQHRELPDGWDRDIPIFSPDEKGDASRNTSGRVLNAIAKNVPWLIGGAAAMINDLEQALYASKIVSYAQWYQLMRAAAGEQAWNLNYGGIALMWRSGCIIRSAFLDDIKQAFDAEPGLGNLMLAEFFKKAVENAQAGWRRVAALTIQLGIPTPAISAALSYYDGYRAARLPANLLQAQRDYFGAHTYERIDEPRGLFFHTNWTGRGGATASSTYEG